MTAIRPSVRSPTCENTAGDRSKEPLPQPVLGHLFFSNQMLACFFLWLGFIQVFSYHVLYSCFCSTKRACDNDTGSTYRALIWISIISIIIAILQIYVSTMYFICVICISITKATIILLAVNWPPQEVNPTPGSIEE